MRYGTGEDSLATERMGLLSGVSAEVAGLEIIPPQVGPGAAEAEGGEQGEMGGVLKCSTMAKPPSEEQRYHAENDPK